MNSDTVKSGGRAQDFDGAVLRVARDFRSAASGIGGRSFSTSDLVNK